MARILLYAIWLGFQIRLLLILQTCTRTVESQICSCWSQGYERWVRGGGWWSDRETVALFLWSRARPAAGWVSRGYLRQDDSLHSRMHTSLAWVTRDNERSQVGGENQNVVRYGCWKTWWAFGGINILLHISIDIQVFCSTFGKSKCCSPWSSFQIGRGERQMDRKDSTTCLIVSALSASPCSSWSLTLDTSFLVASSVGLPPSAGLGWEKRWSTLS